MPWQDYNKPAWYHDPEQDLTKFFHLALENTDDHSAHPLTGQVQLSVAVAEFLYDNDVDITMCVGNSAPKGDFGDKAALFVHNGPFHRHLVKAEVSGVRLVGEEGDKELYSAPRLGGVPRLGDGLG